MIILAVSYPSSKTYPTKRILSICFAASIRVSLSRKTRRASIGLPWIEILFTKPVNVGDTLTAEAKEVHNGKSTGVYLITVTNQKNEQVALFKGTCFRTGKKLV